MIDVFEDYAQLFPQDSGNKCKEHQIPVGLETRRTSIIVRDVWTQVFAVFRPWLSRHFILFYDI